jgi:hypothetical protein
VAPDGESFRADAPQHISDRLAEVVRNVEQRAKGDGAGESENGAFDEACKYESNEAEVQTQSLEKNEADWWEEFLAWEGTSPDTVDFKTIYVDMAGDVIAGLLLSQIVYWYLPSKKDGRPKLRVYKDGHYWIAKARKDWWDELRIRAKRADRALSILEKKGLIVTAVYKFNRAPTTHIRIVKEKFLTAWAARLASLQEEQPIFPKGEYPNGLSSQKGKIDVPQRGKSITESTTETTREKGRESSNSKFPSLSFSTEREWDDTPPEGGLIETAIDGVSRFFRDESIKSNRTHAKKLWNKTDLEEEEFVEVVQQAKRITAKRWSNITNSKMAYFFAVLKDKLDLRG